VPRKPIGPINERDESTLSGYISSIYRHDSFRKRRGRYAFEGAVPDDLTDVSIYYYSRQYLAREKLRRILARGEQAWIGRDLTGSAGTKINDWVVITTEETDILKSTVKREIHEAETQKDPVFKGFTHKQWVKAKPGATLDRRYVFSTEERYVVAPDDAVGFIMTMISRDNFDKENYGKIAVSFHTGTGLPRLPFDPMYALVDPSDLEPSENPRTFSVDD
jgi:hypothetical protein